MKNIFNNKLVLSFACICATTLMIAQPQSEVKQPKPSVMKAATKEYEKFAYVDAISTYERIAQKGYKSVDLFQRLGNSYYFNAQLSEANNWYKQLFELNEEVDAEYYYRYAQTLKSVGNYKKADEMLVKFNKLSGNDERGKL
jgi:tetratricopeptide (TPR) repeat protein